MPSSKLQSNDIFELPQGFEATCLEVFSYQAEKNSLYKQFLSGLQIDSGKITRSADIPFLPVGFFKTHQVSNEGLMTDIVFSSSGTEGTGQSKHYVADKTLYNRSFRECFKHFYGDIREYAVLALLPSYLEREGSSLVYMAQDMISTSLHPENGFFLNNLEELHSTLVKLESVGQKTLLLGVTYALLDFAEAFPMKLKHTLVMETGGMKGRRKELVREELHGFLCSAFGIKSVHSEYGMTELLSQAYSKGGGIFHCPPWMRIQARDTNDPFSQARVGKTGGINIIDLANLNSCSFIATQDLGKVHDDGSFEIQGRFDNSDLRGCNLMIS